MRSLSGHFRFDISSARVSRKPTNRSRILVTICPLSSGLSDSFIKKTTSTFPSGDMSILACRRISAHVVTSSASLPSCEVSVLPPRVRFAASKASGETHSIRSIVVLTGSNFVSRASSVVSSEIDCTRLALPIRGEEGEKRTCDRGADNDTGRFRAESQIAAGTAG